MNIPTKYINYIILISIFLVIGVSAYLYLLPNINKLEKTFVIWFAVIIEINLIHFYYILKFYEENKNKKGIKGGKGDTGPRGFKGNSEKCTQCGPSHDSTYAGTINDKGKLLENSDVLRGQCKFPFVYENEYHYNCLKDRKPPSIKHTKTENDANLYGWCPTELNVEQQPIKYGYCNESENIMDKMEREKKYLDARANYMNDNYGILDVDIVKENTYKKAVAKCNKKGSNYTLLDTDLNANDSGPSSQAIQNTSKFMYVCYDKGFGNLGISDLKLSQVNNETFGNGNDYTLIDQNLNDTNNDADNLFLYKKKTNGGFYKDLQIHDITCPKDYTKITSSTHKTVTLNRKPTSISNGNNAGSNYYIEFEISDKKIKIKDLDNNDDKYDDNSFKLKKGDIVEGINEVDFKNIEDLKIFKTKYDGVTANDNNKFIFKIESGDLHEGDKNLVLCATKLQNTDLIIDTAFKYKGVLYIFRGNEFYKMSRLPVQNVLKVEENYPKKISERWFSTTDCSNYNSDECNDHPNCRYSNSKCENIKFRAVFTYGFNKKTYLFRGSNVYLYDDKNLKIQDGYPKLIDQVFKGVPTNIDAVFTWGKDGATYFFKGPLYYKYNDKKKKIESGYPKQSKNRWPGMPNVIDAIFTLDYSLDSQDTHPTYVISGNRSYYIDPYTDQLKPKQSIEKRFTGMFEASALATAKALA